ncbi:MAG: DUF530 family protein [Candidatus Micrarchaeota archaeon]
MSDSYRLAREANEFLDSILQPEEQNLQKLSDYRAKMVEAGFAAPFRTLVAKLQSDFLENSAAEAQDLKKHLSEIRYAASLKKATLNRCRVAIAAHRLAQAFEDFGQGEFVKFLPLGGDYRKRLIESGEAAVDAYHSLLSIFEQGRHPMKSASALVSFMSEGVEVERTINLDADKNAQEHIKSIFGPDAKVKDVQIKRKTVSMIKNYSTKVALFCAACTYAASIADERMLLGQKQDASISKYNKIMKSYGLSPDADISETDKFENVREEMQKEGFIQKIGLSWIMPDEFKGRLHKRRTERKRAAISQAHMGVYQILQWYYICHNKEGRAAYGSMPSVLIEPQGAQLMPMQELTQPGYLISNPQKLILEKMEMEKTAPPISPKVWGPAFVCINAGVSHKWAAEEFGVDILEIEKAVKLMRPLIEQPQGRGAQFLGKLK